MLDIADGSVKPHHGHALTMDGSGSFTAVF